MAKRARLPNACCLLICAAVVPPAGAGISYVQGAIATSTGRHAVAALTFPSTQSRGDLNVVFIACADPDAEVVSVTDTSGNLYLRAGAISRPGVATQIAYYASNIVRAAPGRNTVTMILSAAVDTPRMAIVEYHGIDIRGALDVTASASGTSMTASAGSLVTSNPGDLLIASASTAGEVLAPGPSYTQRLLANDASSIVEDTVADAAGTYSATAMQSSPGWYLVQFLAFRASRENFAPPPYPQSRVVAGMRWDFSTVLSHRKAIGSDIWPTTWAADGNLYAAWGDGGGFDGTERSKATGRASLGFARLSGTPQPAEPASFSGKNVWGQAPAFAEAQATFGGKVVDLISVNGVLYAQGGLWTRANCACSDPTVRREDNPLRRTLAWSLDLGRSWQLAPWSSATDLGSSLQFGQNYAGAFDPEHIYLYYQREVTADSTHVYLRRVRSDQLTADPSGSDHFEYFSGLDPAGGAHWSMTEADAEAVFFDRNSSAGTFALASVVYDAPLGRYLLAVWHGTATGQIGFFEGQNPWGPWATMGYYDDWGGFNETAGEATGLSLPSKWISSDGRTLWVVFSGVNNGGNNEFDSFNLVKVILQ